MITAIVALALLARVQEPNSAPSGPKAADLVSKMFRYYASADSLMGSIKMEQSAAGHSVVIDTTIAYDKPSKFYLKQDLKSADPHTWLVTSDGKYFSYEAPSVSDLAAKGKRLMEPVSPQPGVTLDFRAIYRAAGLSMGDRQLPEDLAIAGDDELQVIKDQIATIRYDGTQKLGDTAVNVLSGDWREYGRAPVSGSFQMFVTDDGQLKRYARREILAVNLKNGVAMPPAEVITVWTVDLKVNAKPDAQLFTLAR